MVYIGDAPKTPDGPSPPTKIQKNNSSPYTTTGPEHDDYVKDQSPRIVELRTLGWRIDQISVALRISEPRIKQALAEYLQSSIVDPIDVETVRAVELARLDEMHRAVYERALEGDTRSIRTALEISKRRSTIAGLDKPRRIDTHHTGAVDQRVQIYLPDNGRTREDTKAIDAKVLDTKAIDAKVLDAKVLDAKVVGAKVLDDARPVTSDRIAGRELGAKLRKGDG